MIRRITWFFIVMLFTNAPGLAQPALKPEKLSLLKRGTVLVRTRTQSGSGFVAAVRQKQAYCVTNAHVLGKRRSQSESVEVIVDSGSATPRRATAKVVAFDEAGDLAILSFSMTNPPPILPLAANAETLETTPVFVLGFPFGKMLSTERDTPPVTVSRASVSAQRRDRDGFIEHLQLDGELNPGNSGGPIVDVEGKVLGVAVAKVGGTNISFGIPIDAVQAILDGRVSGWNFREVPGEKSTIEFDVTVTTLDPLGRIKRICVMTASSKKQESAATGKPGEFKALRGAKEHALEIHDGTAAGRVSVPFNSRGASADLFQIKCVAEGSGVTFTEPSVLPASQMSDVPQAEPRVDSADEPPEEFDMPSGPLDGEKLIKMPAEIEAVEVAGGGRFLVMKLRDLPALTVVDVYSGEIAKHIRMPSSDFVYAAGGNNAVVYLREENVLHAYDLTTFERRKAKPNPFSPVISQIVMSYGRGSLALVRHSPGTEQHSQTKISLLDALRLEAIVLPETGRNSAIPSHNTLYRDVVHFRANRDMSLITEWARSHSPSGVGLLLRRGTTFEQRYNHDSAGYLDVGDDGRIYTETGNIYSQRLDLFGRINEQRLFVGLGGILYLSLSAEGKLTLYQCGSTKPLGPIGEFPNWVMDDARGYGRRDVLQFDRRITFLPTQGRLVFLPFDNNSVLVRNFDLKTSLDAAGVDYLVIRSNPPVPARAGTEWSYQIDAISRAGGVTYSLELAPEKMELSDKGLITWTPPAAAVGNEETIIVLVKDASGEEAYHKFVLPVVRR